MAEPMNTIQRDSRGTHGDEIWGAEMESEFLWDTADENRCDNSGMRTKYKGTFKDYDDDCLRWSDLGRW
jgi:hypothetical protein